MFLIRSLLVMGLFFGLTALVDAGDAQKGKKKKAGAPIQGIVKSVQADKEKPDTGILSFAPITGKAKKGTPPPTGEERKVTINTATKIEKLEGKLKQTKGQPPPAGQPAKFGDIGANAQVVVTLKAGENNIAEKVQIISAKKKKKSAEVE
jgi:hypothetical protein